MGNWGKIDPELTHALVKDILIPHIGQLEAELHALRLAVWPYVQAKKEELATVNLQEKARFCRCLEDEETLRELLVEKQKFTKNVKMTVKKEGEIFTCSSC
jgi:hypothetical protein